MSVHIIIPTHNPDSSLTRAVEAALSQTYQDVLVTVIDDCSDQPVWEKIVQFKHEPRFRYVRLAKNVGPSTARNVGLLFSNQAEYVTFHDDDDLPKPNKIAVQYAALQESRVVDENRKMTVDKASAEQYEVAVSRVIRHETDGTIQESGAMGYLFRDIYPNAYAHFGAAGRKYSLHVVSSLFRKSVFYRLGGFYPGLYHYEDNELAARLILGGVTFNFIEEPLYEFIKSPQSLTYQHDDGHDQTKAIFEHINDMKRTSATGSSSDFSHTYCQTMMGEIIIQETHNIAVNDIDTYMPVERDVSSLITKAII